MTTPWDAITPEDEQAALGSITKMMTGTKMLQDQPGVVYALANQKAHPADAQAIDQFMQGLDAEKQVRLAATTGQKILLSAQQRTVLGALGVDYSGVQYTQKDALNDTANQISQQSSGAQQAKRNPDGSFALDKNGNVQVEESHPYKAKGIGRLFQTLHNDILKPISRDAVGPALHGLIAAWNTVNSSISDERAVNMAGVGGGADAMIQASQSRSQEMQAAGYDPNSIWSHVAFQASGKAHADLTPLADRWDNQNPSGLNGWNGQQALTEAEKFLNDPKVYRQGIENDSTLTPEQAAQKLGNLSSAQFEDLTRRVAGKTASIGNDFTNAVGVDPVKHSTAYALASAGANLAAAFMIDPTLMLGRAVQVAKINRIGIDTLGDSLGAAKRLDPALGTNEVQRGWLTGIDIKNQIKAADEAGDTVKAAALTARFKAELPSIAPLLPDLLGKNAIVGYAERVVDGKRIAEPVFGETEGINSLADAANYVASKSALIRLMNGRAATQASLMPGALSAFGLRKVKGAVAEWMTTRSAQRAENAYSSVISAAKADPALAEKLISEGDLLRLQPEANDAISAVTNNVIANKANFLRADLGLLMGSMREARPAAAEREAITSELDDMEARLQELMADKTANPGEIEHLHEAIQTGRDMLSMHEAAHVGTAADLEMAQKIHQGTLALENSARAAGDVTDNAVASKASSGAVNGLASQARAQFALTPAGKGNIAYNLRRSGDPLGGARIGWSSPTAIAARSRLAAQRISTLLPRNTLIDINDAASGDKLYKLAMTYLNRGDANAFLSAWNLGNGGQRKALIGGLIDQLGHAAGLGKTSSGQKVLDAAKTNVEAYSSVGDEAILDGQALALHAGQVRTSWLLPTFRSLQQASAKIGLWEATMGRALTTNQADVLMSQWKMGTLFKPSTITRNQLEGWGRAALEGKWGDAMKAKAVLSMPNRELWARGLAPESQKLHDSLVADGKLKEAEQIARGNMLGGDVLGRSKPLTKLAEFAPFALAGRAYRTMFGKVMNEAHIEAIAGLGAEDLSKAMEEYGQQIREADLGLRNGARQSSEIAQAGYGPATLRRAIDRGMRKSDRAAKGESVKWTQMDADGTTGADRYANALAQRVNSTPAVAHAVMDHLENPEDFNINHVIQALDDPAIAKQMHLTGWGSVYWEDGGTNAIRATTPDEVMIGKQEWANKVVNDYRYLLTGQNGKYQEVLAKEIRQTGKAPDADWIASKLTGHNRPHSVLAPEVMAMPNGGERGLIAALQDVEGAGYQWLVERPLQRTTSSPVFAANYAEARVGLNPVVERLVQDQGISREAAENMAKELSIKNSWIKTEQLIDDPGQKSQFDIVARNMFPFSRATQAMIRRWGTGLWQDPARARKMMLAYEGSTQSGLVYTNQYGEPTFTYPGSGVLNMLLRDTVGKIPGFEGMFRFPVASNMTGGVLMSVPGADNPLRMSMGPMLTIPMREVFRLFPDHRSVLDEIDRAINGPVGQGETFAQLEPTAVRKILTGMNDDQRNSALASSMIGAIANLAAGGQIPPADASPSERDAFIQNVKSQVKSQLYLRAVFGLFAPAAPSTPTEGTSASQADYAFHVSGIGQLSDEYKTVLNDVHGDLARANAIWAAMHPDKLVYEVGHSHANASKVGLPATQEALNWMTSNAGFVGKYKSVAAYFLPQGSGNEPFSDAAYKTQLELGLRQRKSATEFYADIRVRNAESIFYPAVDGFNSRIAAAKAVGDKSTEQQWTQAKSEWENQFKNLNPLFAAKIDSYGDARAQATGQLADLQKMVKEGSVPDGQGPLLSRMLHAYDGYNQFIQTHKGADNSSVAMRQQALEMFNNWATQHVAGTPLADLYAGVFRTLNTNLVNLATTGG